MNRLLQQEQGYTPITAAITVAAILTGLITYLIDSNAIELQWAVLFHLILGVLLSLALPPYLLVHFRRTVGLRRTRVLISGLLTILFSGGIIYTGWHILILGRRESEAWVYHAHIITSALLIVFVFIHLFWHVKLPSRKRNRRIEALFPSILPATGKYVLKLNILLLLVIIIASISYRYLMQPSLGLSDIHQVELADSADHRQVASSSRCASCHGEISMQWLSSAHQQAASDPAYVASAAMISDEKGNNATGYCKTCHAPGEHLAGQMSLESQSSRVSEKVANQEGISCIGCHQSEAIEYQNNGSGYLFAQSDNPILMRIHDMLVRVKPDQHIRYSGNPLLRDSEFCSSCHTQLMVKGTNDRGIIEIQDEYSAWLKSPYSGPHESGLSNTLVEHCQDCHMQKISAVDPSSDRDGMVRSHHFPGANTFLPLIRGDRQKLEATRVFLRSNKMRLSIDKPNRKDALQTLQTLHENIRSFEETPYYFYLGEKADIQVVVSNRGVGHDFPGGTIDINQAWVEFLVLDAEGNTVYSSGEIDENNYVDPAAHFYRSLPVDHNGDLIWRHDLFNMVGESFRRVIKAGGSDIVSFSFEVPSWVKSPLTITSTLKYRKMNQRYAKWVLNGKDIEIPVVNVAWDSLDIPVKIRREVDGS